MSTKKDKRRLRIKGDGRLRELAASITAWGARGMSRDQAFAMGEAQDEQINDPPLDQNEFSETFKEAWAIVRAEAKEEYFQDLHEVEARKPEFLVNPLIPRGALTMLDGHPGQGKSMITTHLAAAVTTGGCFAERYTVPKGRVLFMAPEDDADRVLRPRLESQGANLKKIRFMVHPHKLDEYGRSLLRKELVDHRPELVVIDPLPPFMADDTNTYRATEVRGFMQPLALLAREMDIAILLVRHLRKGGSAFAIEAGQGSMDFIAAVRSGLIVLLARYLDRNEADTIGVIQGNFLEKTPEDYVVSGLINFPDVSYDDNADLLYDLAGQVVEHLRSRMEHNELMALLQAEQDAIARAVRAQMLNHYWIDDTVEYEAVVKQGFTEIRSSAHTSEKTEPLDYRSPPADKSNMARYLFGGYSKCLLTPVRFQSDTERKLSVILERESLKWFKPAKGQFQMFYRDGSDHQEYVPDFVAETETEILMLEPKMATKMQDSDVLAKRDVAIKWCLQASEHGMSHGGKPWRYALIPHDQIQDNMGLDFLLKLYAYK